MNAQDVGQIEILNTKFDTLSRDVAEIKQALIGNDFGDTGLVKRVVRVEEDVQSLKDWKTKMVAQAAGAAAVGASGASAIINMLL